MADRGRKRERGKYKIWISGEPKELFRWNKKHFLQSSKNFSSPKTRKNNQGVNQKWVHQSIDIYISLVLIWSLHNHKYVQTLHLVTYSTLSDNIYICIYTYIFFKAVIIIMCDSFWKIIKNIFLLCIGMWLN